MYCKCNNRERGGCNKVVLIVTKCIVNSVQQSQRPLLKSVLIVAKCIVNRNRSMYFQQLGQVLIVAKCIVNFINSKNSASLTSY